MDENNNVEQATPMMVQTTERLTDADKNSLDMVKMKRELALEKARTALSNSENAELQYNHLILQLAHKYSLVDGDKIAEDGSIMRKTK